MKLLDPSTWFGRNSEQPHPATTTGAMIRSTTAHPGDAKLIREMTDLSAKLARGAADYNDKMFRSFDAAETTNWNQDFKGTYGTANTEIFTYFYRIWARCRTIAKDMPHGKAIIRTYQNNVVGHDPFALTMRVGKNVKQPHPETGQTVTVFEPDEDANRLIVKEWKKFCRAKNFTIRRTISLMEALNQIVAESVTIGSCLIRLWRGFPGNKYRFAVDLLESDRLQPNYHGRAPGSGNPIRASIEYHPVWNYPVAYWLLTRHPGEFVQTNYPGPGVSNGQLLRERVPAEDIIHYNNLRNRAEQDLGFTELEACVQSIYMNFKYAGALTQASLASCCKPWVIEKNTPTGLSYTPTSDEYQSLISAADTQGNKSLENQGLNVPNPQRGNTPNTEVMSPAMTKVLEWGFTMKVLDPKFPIEAAHEFRVDNNKEIASAAGISYSALTGDFQSLGYIAAQMSKQPERDNFMVHQANLADVVVSRIFEEWLSESVQYGALDFPRAQLEDIGDAATFKAKRWPFTDMLREVQALILKKDARLISPQQAQDELPDGIAYADVVAQISEAKQTESAHGLVDLEFDPTQVMVKDAETDPANPPAGGDGGEPTAETNKPIMPKGSKTAKGQKTASVRGKIAPQVLSMIQKEE